MPHYKMMLTLRMPNLSAYSDYKGILNQCRIQSYFEAGILVWEPKLRSTNSQKCKN